jgi:hypothetical protein
MPSVEATLAAVDWDRYVEETTLAIEDAVRHYTAGTKGAGGAPVREVSIATDPQRRLTSVGFQTTRRVLRRGGLITRSADGIAVDYPMPSYPTEFELYEFHCVYHPCLVSLVGLDFEQARVFLAVVTRIHSLLRRVREDSLRRGVFDEIRDARFWVGLNSPDDWYGDVLEVPPR